MCKALLDVHLQVKTYKLKLVIAPFEREGKVKWIFGTKLNENGNMNDGSSILHFRFKSWTTQNGEYRYHHIYYVYHITIHTNFNSNLLTSKLNQAISS